MTNAEGRLSRRSFLSAATAVAASSALASGVVLAGTGENSPQLQDGEAYRWTAQNLAGTDGWNPLGI